MTQEQLTTWTARMADAAVAVAMAQAFRDDRAARRHWLGCASRDLEAAHTVRQAARIEAAERGPILTDDVEAFLFAA